MLEQIWTAFLVGLLSVSLGVWGVLVCRAKGIHPFRDIIVFFRRQTNVDKVLLGLFLLVMWVFASTKPEGEYAAGDGDEGTNGVNQVAAEVMGALMTSEYSGDRLEILTDVTSISFANDSSGNESQEESAAEIASTNTTETLDVEDFERKFVLARVGTGEEMSFAPPTNAIVCSDWKTFGAATDWIYLTIEDDWFFTLGTNTINRFRVSSFGKVEPFVQDEASTWFAPMGAELGIVPECNWPFLREVPSQFWYCISPSNTLQLTWQNVLLGRAVTNAVSFQVELWPQGKFVYHYDLSHLEDEAISKSDEMYLYDTDPYNKDTDYDGLTDYEELFVYHIDESFVMLDKISVSKAQQMTDEDFKTNTVFYCYPSSMDSTNISPLVRTAHLTMGIPALAKATGARNLSPVIIPHNNVDLNQTESQMPDDNSNELLNKPNGWPSRGNCDLRWLHSDIKDVAYFYVFNLFEKTIIKGNLK